MTNNRTPYELCMRRDLTPTSTSELDMLFDQYLAMGQALLDKREFSYTKGNVAEWMKWAYYTTNWTGR